MLIVGCVANHPSESGAKLSSPTPSPSISTWSPLVNMSSGLAAGGGRCGHAGVAFGSKMMIQSGYYKLGKSFESGGDIYDVLSGKWTAMAIQPSPVYGQDAAAIGNKVYFWGGVVGFRSTDLLATYDIANDRWEYPTNSGAVPSERGGHSAVAINGKLFIWGGFRGKQLDDGAVFDPSSGLWTSLPASILSPRYQHTAVTYQNKMVIWGGKASVIFTSTDGAIYDPSTLSWTMLPASPLSERVNHTSVVVGDKMIIFGGTDSSGTVLGDGAIYDFVTQKWSAFKTPFGSGITEHSAVVIDDKMVVWGGRIGRITDCLAQGVIYDTSNDSWQIK